MYTHTPRPNTRYLIFYLISVLGLLLHSPVQAREKLREEYLSGMNIEPKRTVKYDGARWSYEVRVALPASYRTSNRSYPVLWVTDGSMSFESAVHVASQFTGPLEMIVVSIGTSKEDSDQFSFRRDYDFSSNNKDICEYKGDDAALFVADCKKYWGDSLSGGASNFHRLIAVTLRKEISDSYRTSDIHTLYGYSLGGGFCLYALFTHPESFNRYICASPNVRKGNQIFSLEQEYSSSHTDLKADVFLSAGSEEMTSDPYPAVLSNGVVSGMARVAEILNFRRYPSLRLVSRILPNEIHNKHGIESSLYWGLQSLTHLDETSGK